MLNVIYAERLKYALYAECVIMLNVIYAERLKYALYAVCHYYVRLG
jgi:hypothetical protein